MGSAQDVTGLFQKLHSVFATRGRHPKVMLRVLLVLACASVGANAQIMAQTPAERADLSERPTDAPGIVADVLGLPTVFEENVGQAGAHVSHLLRAGSFSAAFRPDGFDVAVFRRATDDADALDAGPTGNLFGLSFLRTRGARIVPGDRVEGIINILVGADRANWHEAVPAYRELIYRDLYPGVDMVIHHASGALEFALDLQPGIALDTVRFAVHGARELALTKTGALAIRTSGGIIELTAPKAAQIRGDRLEPLPAAFVLLGPQEVGFTVEGRARDARLIVDPKLLFQSWFGGDRRDGMAGASYSRVGPLRPVPDLKISPDGTEIAISGTTDGFSFLQAGGYGVINGTRNAFAARFERQGAGLSLIYATVIGGRGEDFATGVAPYPAPARAPDGGPGVRLRSAPDLFVSGWTQSENFPTSPGAIHETRSHGGGFVALLGATGMFLNGTMIGHGPDAYPNAIALDLPADPAKHALFVGGAIGFASEIDESVNAPSSSPGLGVFDGFVARIKPQLDAYDYLTYVGGSGVDVVQDIAVLDAEAYAVGTTRSFDLPTTPAVFVKQPNHSGIAAGTSATDCLPPASFTPIILHSEFPGPLNCFDGFIARFSPQGDVMFLTYDGVGRGDFLHGVALDRREDFRGFVAAAGSRVWLDEISIAPDQTILVDRSAITLRRATNFGGIFGPNLAYAQTGRSNLGEAIALDSAGRAHIVGTVDQPDLATGPSVHSLIEIEDDDSVIIGAEDALPQMFYLQIGPNATFPDIFDYLGGSRPDLGYAIDVAGVPLDGFCAALLGETGSTDIEPISPAGQPVLDGATDLLLAVLCEIPEIERVTVSKSFSPLEVFQAEGAATFADVEFVIRNDGPSPIEVTLFDELPAGLTFVPEGAQGCNYSLTRLRCNLTVAGGGAHLPITVRVRVQPGTCPGRFENVARLYPGHTSGDGVDPPTGSFYLTSQPTTLNVVCRGRGDCREFDPAGNCYCGPDFGDCIEEGTYCEVSQGELWPMFGICLPEGEASRDCRIQYGWAGGTEFVTIPSGETMTIEQSAMRFVRNFEDRPAVFVQMDREGIVVPEFTLFPGDRDPANIGNYSPVYSPVPPFFGSLPTLLRLKCLTAW